jgi:hypothetical protein
MLSTSGKCEQDWSLIRQGALCKVSVSLAHSDQQIGILSNLLNSQYFTYNIESNLSTAPHQPPPPPSSYSENID